MLQSHMIVYIVGRKLEMVAKLKNPVDKYVVCVKRHAQTVFRLNPLSANLSANV